MNFTVCLMSIPIRERPREEICGVRKVCSLLAGAAALQAHRRAGDYRSEPANGPPSAEALRADKAGRLRCRKWPRGFQPCGQPTTGGVGKSSCRPTGLDSEKPA